MNRKGFAPIIILLIIAGILIVGGIWYYETHKPVEPQLSTMQNATTTPTLATTIVPSSATTTTSSTIVCGTDFSDFAIPPLPTSSYNWTQLTSENATSVYGQIQAVTFSSSTGELIGRDAFEALSPVATTTLLGQQWFSPSGDEGSLDNYYRPILTQEGWTRELSIDGHTIDGDDASGYHGDVQGWVKVQDGYFRAISVDYLTGAPDPTNLIVFASDIIPLSEIISNYQPSCPEIASSSSAYKITPYIQLQISTDNGVIITDPSGRRTGYDPTSNTTYNDIPNASYSSSFGSGYILFSNPPQGLYTVSVIGGFSQYGLMSWIGGNQSPVPVEQDLNGNINKGQTITYWLNYDPNNIASDTLQPSLDSWYQNSIGADATLSVVPAYLVSTNADDPSWNTYAFNYQGKTYSMAVDTDCAPAGCTDSRVYLGNQLIYATDQNTLLDGLGGIIASPNGVYVILNADAQNVSLILDNNLNLVSTVSANADGQGASSTTTTNIPAAVKLILQHPNG